MFRLISSITALLAATAILLLANGLLGTLLAVRMSVEAFGTGATGAIMAFYYLGLLLGAIWASIAVRRVGHARSFAVFAALITAATLTHGLFINGWLWGGLRLVTGFSMAGVYVAIESWLNERGQGDNRGRLFSLYQIASYLGLGTGQLLLNISPIESAELFMIAGTLFALCLVPIAATRAIQPAPLVHTPLRLMPFLRASPVGSCVCFGAGIISGSLLSLAPLFVTAHASIGRVAGFMAALILGGMMLQYPIGHLSDRFDRQSLIVAVTALLSATTGGVWWVADMPFPSLSASAVVMGGLTFTLYPLGVAQMADRVRDQSFVALTSVVLFLWGIGAAAGPLAVGKLMAFAGVDGLLMAVGGVAAALSLITFILRYDPLPPSEQSAFQSMSNTTPVLAGLDPRTDAVDPQLDWIYELGRGRGEHEVPSSQQPNRSSDRRRQSDRRVGNH